MAVNKHKILQDWVDAFLTEQYLYFQSADAIANTRTIAPQVGDHVIKTDILGYKYKEYTFVFVGYEQIDTGTNDRNTTNMMIFDLFNEWLEEQQENKNFPDFGPTCSEYKIVPLQNMAKLATITEDGLAKYMFAAKIEYKEE